MATNPFKELGPRRFGFYHLLGQKAHEHFMNWVTERQGCIRTVLEVGCGYFDYYTHFFRGKGTQYTGWDIDQDIIDYRKVINPEHKFITGNFRDYNYPTKYDLVFHHMVLSGLIGMEANVAILKATVRASKKFGYGVFWNTDNINLPDLILTLKHEGCNNINIFMEPTLLHKKFPQKQLIIHWSNNANRRRYTNT